MYEVQKAMKPLKPNVTCVRHSDSEAYLTVSQTAAVFMHVCIIPK